MSVGNYIFHFLISQVTFAFTSLLYRLAVNPEAQDKLREEIRSKETNRYLKACLKESLRIWHVIPANLRRTSKEHVVGGYQIPKGVSFSRNATVNLRHLQ